jgi:hypothetical protein
MTFQVTIEAICDGGCDGEWFETITREYTVVLPVGPIKDKLRQQGWRVRADELYCPACCERLGKRPS